MHQIQRALRRAFDVWGSVTHLDFREVMLGDADIRVQFAHGYHSDGYPFDGPGERSGTQHARIQADTHAH